ncbi:hypothetical protein D4R86_02865 [bacterium]|nr:MAG: hypothetical protein D4R86_02865 [bacterium]
MEGNLQKNNSEAISQKPEIKSSEEKVVNKETIAKEEQKSKPKKGLYEIRTMRHDIDEAKGKNVSTLSLTEENLSVVGKKSKIEEISSGEIRSISPLATEDSLKEGNIDFDAKEKKQSLKKPFLISLRRIFEKKIIFRLATVLIIIVFIGGAGFYFYKSGALSSFGNIGEMIRDLFNKEAPDEVPIIPPATSTPDIPIQPNPTSTLPIIDDPQLKYSPAFFSPDEEEIIKVDTLEEVYPGLKASFEKGTKEDNFKRIIVLARNDFSNISLAQMWKTLKTLVLGEKYTELISAEIVESWGLAMPSNVDKKLSENYNLFFYGQPEDGPRAVLIFKVDNITGLKDEMFLWEETMIYDLKKLFLGINYEEVASASYLDNVYKDISIRYLNLPEHDLTMDYAIMPGKNYLILSTSRESIWATIDKILEDGDVTINNENDEFAGWKTYRNEEYGFEVKYPKEAKTEESWEGKGGNMINIITPISESGYGYDIGINVIENTENLPVKDWCVNYYEALEKEAEERNYSFNHTEGEEVSLNDMPGYKISIINQNRLETHIYIDNATFVYDINYNDESANDPDWDVHKQKINQIISVFKLND